MALPPVCPPATVITPVALLTVVPAAMAALSPPTKNVTLEAFAGVFLAENDSPATGGTVTRPWLTWRSLSFTKPPACRKRPDEGGGVAGISPRADTPCATLTACRSTASSGVLIRSSPEGVGSPVG